MGLAVIKGERQRRVGGELALEHGYSPQRRSLMWNIENQLIGKMGRGPRPEVGENVETREDLSPYQKLFIRFVREELTKVSGDYNGPEQAREPVEKNGKLLESYGKHAFYRAKRRVGKEFLKHLYLAWRAITFPQPTPTTPAVQAEREPEMA